MNRTILALFIAVSIPTIALAQQDLQPQEQEQTQPQPPSITVTPMRPAAPERPVTRIEGVLKAQYDVTLSSPMTGTIAALPFKEGESFKKGDTLVQFDCTEQKAALDVSQASYKAAAARYKATSRLHELGSSTDLEVELSRAERDKTFSEIEMRKVPVSQCLIKAPFDGTVVVSSAEEHETISETTPLLQIISNQEPTVEMLIPSDIIRHVKIGGIFSITINETGKVYQGTIDRIVGRIEPVSRTISIFGKINANQDKDLMPGMTGTISLVTQGSL